MSGPKRGKCPKCGYSAYERTGQDANGFFTFYKCRKDCGLVRPMPDGTFIGIDYDAEHSHRGARKHKCPNCGLPSTGKTTCRGTARAYTVITCDTCGRYSSFNGGAWKPVGEHFSVPRIKPKPRLTVEKALAPKAPDLPDLTGLKPVHHPSKVRNLAPYKERNWATDATGSTRKAGWPIRRSTVSEEELFNVYEGSVVRGNIDVKRRWEREEREEARRLREELAKDEWE